MEKIYAIVDHEENIIVLDTDLQKLKKVKEKMHFLDPVGIEEVKEKTWNTDIFDDDCMIEKLCELNDICDYENENVFDNLERISQPNWRKLEKKLAETLLDFLKEEEIKTNLYEVINRRIE